MMPGPMDEVQIAESTDEMKSKMGTPDPERKLSGCFCLVRTAACPDDFLRELKVYASVERSEIGH